MNELSVASVFQSHMILQRDKTAVLWGKAPVGSAVTVELSNGPHKLSFREDTTAEKDAKWLCRLPPQKAGKNYTVTVSCSMPETEPVILEDIYFGDVWLACGQSNMEFFLRYDENWDTVKNYEKNENIRMYNVPRTAFEGHRKNAADGGFWFEEFDSAWETFSAPGYSFARNIQPVLGIPIGIIGCNWGGTTAAAWLDERCLFEQPLCIYLEEYEEALLAFSSEELEKKSLEGWKFEDSPAHVRDFIPVMYGLNEEGQKRYLEANRDAPVIPMGPWNINRPGGLYHQMLEPLIPFSIKGVLWYQGESDALHAEAYDRLLTSLITCWRSAWKDDFPFLFVQLAPFEKWLECDACGYPELRRRQELVSRTVPGAAMTSIMDIGMYYDIHPKKKMEVGRRLSLLARGKVYGEALSCEPPEPEWYEKKGGRIILSFASCKSLFTKNPAPGTKISVNGFILKQDGLSVPISRISVEGKKIILEAENLKPGPCTVFFACSNYVEVNVWNEEGIPVKPFTLTLTDAVPSFCASCDCIFRQTTRNLPFVT